MKKSYRILALAPTAHVLGWALFEDESLSYFAEVGWSGRSTARVVQVLLADLRPDLVVVRRSRMQLQILRMLARRGWEWKSTPLSRAKKVVVGDGWASERHLREVLTAVFPQIRAGRKAVVRTPILSAVAVGLCEALVFRLR